ncbi:MAG: hypothetical protein M3022_13865 [Actinomycetota bacterium]|nr:hypothetical protein [Actinomycetota bacterium]
MPRHSAAVRLRTILIARLMAADPGTGMLVGETQTFASGTYDDEYRIAPPAWPRRCWPA